jgi:hypothetical protein
LAGTPLNFAPKSKLSDYGKLFLKDLIGAVGRGWKQAFDHPIPLPRGRQLLARIGVMRPLNRHVERVFDPVGKTIIGAAES